ncbi:hypothetical protein D3C80_1805460 [compost metagenome]
MPAAKTPGREHTKMAAAISISVKPNMADLKAAHLFAYSTQAIKAAPAHAHLAEILTFA